MAFSASPEELSADLAQQLLSRAWTANSMKQVEKKSFLVIDKENRLLSHLTGHPLLTDLLSGYLIRLVCPSSSSQVQDLIPRVPSVVVLNLSSLTGKTKDWIKTFANMPEVTTVLACENERELEGVDRNSIVLAAGPDETLVEIIRSILEEKRLSEELVQQRRAARQLRFRQRQLRREVDDLLAVGEIARSISSTLLLEEILKGILKGIRQMLSLDKVLLSLVNSETEEEEVKVAVGISELNARDCKWKISGEDPIWNRLKVEGKPLILDCDSSPAIPPLLLRTFEGKFIKAPMVVKGQFIGTIMAECSAGHFTNRELRLLQILVEYAGIAIENGRLFYEVIKSEEELKKTQHQLVDAERLAVIGQLAVSINHEINNPLCNISLITQTLKARLGGEFPRVVERLEAIEQNIERIRVVTEKISQIKDAHSTEYLPDQLMINLR